MEQNEFGPKPVLACPLPVFGVTAFATKWGSSASHKSPCRRTARDERVSLIRDCRHDGALFGEIAYQEVRHLRVSHEYLVINCFICLLLHFSL